MDVYAPEITQSPYLSITETSRFDGKFYFSE